MSTPEHTVKNDDGGRPVRAGTVVWGLIAITVGILVLLAQLVDINLDTGLVLMGLLVGTGIALVVGGLVSMAGRK
ncbi:hypothetical protein IWX64_000159 [Arthrobacter sp. CAN_A212]|uniref:hypothetical protein n=1 Tax=unclassified Arthrobacter TaxID=235627 RepID=UPI0018CAC9C9|nr:hypothetical protein [Arthrobacter sp. CAN_C5]MBP2215664.1 hypothetical protein [Arthrobacter sp. CAN_C5]